MRKIRIIEQISLDGVIQAPGGPNGMPTLPALTTAVVPTIRDKAGLGAARRAANCSCVRPS